MIISKREMNIKSYFGNQKTHRKKSKEMRSFFKKIFNI